VKIININSIYLFKTENNLFTPPNNEEPISLWFWMDLEDNTRNYPLGTWTMKFFIDGEFIQRILQKLYLKKKIQLKVQ